MLSNNSLIMSLIKKLFLLLSIVMINYGNLSAQAEITAIVNNPENMRILIQVKSTDQVWVGLTFNYDTHNEVDIKPQKVGPGESAAVFDVSKIHSSVNIAKRAFTNPTSLSRNEIIGEGIPYATAIWGKKVNVVKCALSNGGSPCKYCKKNGYHFENRLDRETEDYDVHGKRDYIKK